FGFGVICSDPSFISPPRLSKGANLFSSATLQNRTSAYPEEFFKRLKFSSPPLSSLNTQCVDSMFPGWRLVLLSIGLITLGMAITRLFFFRVLESPIFLLTKGRAREAASVISELKRWNGVIDSTDDELEVIQSDELDIDDTLSGEDDGLLRVNNCQSNPREEESVYKKKRDWNKKFLEFFDDQIIPLFAKDMIV
ncbi:hypothetical protein HK096_000659, partial [Nowakowskiella sp. JEL0078]